MITLQYLFWDRFYFLNLVFGGKNEYGFRSLQNYGYQNYVEFNGQTMMITEYFL